MKWLGVILLLVSCSTKPNPKSCADGLCTDQQYPFCDVDGTLGGEANECIAVACAPDEFAACRDDKELRCNPTGNNYDVAQCELGCSAALDGCRLCEPNETRCTNGKVATCGAAGEVISSESCAFGCFDDQPRCRRIDPSNNLGTYLDMTTFLIDVDYSNAVFEADTGTVRVGTQQVSVPTYTVLAAGTGVPIRVFVAKSFTLQSASFVATGDPRERATYGIALLAHGDIRISGEVLVDSRVGGAVTGCSPGPGSAMDYGDGNGAASGGGGGGNASDGANGGEVVGRHTPGVKDAASGAATLVPLRGGCAGGFIDSVVGSGTYHNGGGAIQMSSNTKIEIDARIDVRGQIGNSDQVASAIYTGGGGAGGGILLEASTISLGPNAKLLASGGNGFQACTNPSTYCGAAGQGATATNPATSGASVPYTPASNTTISAGGGGGGLGRIRINSRTGEYTKSSTAVEDAAVTTGMVRTR